jgi:DNA-binding beta-propeller fold protein YncE
MNKRITTFFSAAAVAAAMGVLSAQGSIPELTFDSNADFLQMPANTWMGEAAGVATNSKGDIFVYTRTGNPTMTLGASRAVSHGGSRLFQFDKSGKFVREIGQGAYGLLQAQAVRVDPQDNVWIVDQASQQVIKFDPNGRVSAIWGRKPEALRVPTLGLTPPPYGVPVNQAAPAGGEGRGGGRGGPGGGAPGAGRGEPPAGAPPAPNAAPQGRGGFGGGAPQAGGVPGEGFSRPADVAWDSQGNLYVADGIGGARIAKYQGSGRWTKGWGTRGSGQGQFNIIHGIVIDAQQNVYVADEGNKRIQVFDTDGNFKREITGIGSPTAMCITQGPRQVMYVAHTGDPDGMEDAAIYKIDLDGKILGKFGKAGKQVKEFNLVNALDCRSENELLVGELGSWRVQKVTLRASR